MPNDDANSPTTPTPWEARENAHVMLGQVHGLIYLAVEEADSFFYKGTTDVVGSPVLIADDIRKAAAEIHPKFGVVHAALNTGKCDEDLVHAGMGGAQGNLKKKGLASAITEWLKTTTNNVAERLGRLRGALGWSSTILGSLTAALAKELENLPGGASASEAIKEFLEALEKLAEAAEKRRKKAD
jgi:hypothetical protein